MSRPLPARRRLLLALTVSMLLATVLAGCHDDAPGDERDGVGDDPGDGDNDGGDEPDLPQEEGFASRVLTSNLSAPYTLEWGPDDALWVTERTGKAVVRVQPTTGAILSRVTIPDVYQTAPQDGLMGLAFHPQFGDGSGNDFVYLAYTYDADNGTVEERRTKIARFTYDAEAGTLSERMDLLTGLEGSIDHNSGRLLWGPDDKLYYTIGDQGKNQFSLYCEEIQAQRLPTAEEVAAENWTTYQGKVLRMDPDGSIPEDNPTLDGVRSHIYTYGHRNAQGLALGPDGDLYISEHGPRSDDEFNRLEAGKNYGWPHVAGHQDDQAYEYENWSGAENCEELQYRDEDIPSEVPVQEESEFDHPDYVGPVHAFGTVDDDHDFVDPACGNIQYVCWPTVAPTGLQYYEHDAIPGWEGDMLMTTLKDGRLHRLPLNDDGTELTGDTVEMFRSENRYRDVAIGPDGRTIYIITDITGPVRAFGGGATTELTHPGSILMFTYEG